MSTNSDNPRSTFNRHQETNDFHPMSGTAQARHIVLIAEGAFGFQQRTALRIILLRKINGSHWDTKKGSMGISGSDSLEVRKRTILYHILSHIFWGYSDWPWNIGHPKAWHGRYLLNRILEFPSWIWWWIEQLAIPKLDSNRDSPWFPNFGIMKDSPI
jgi:hypothetical protein